MKSHILLIFSLTFCACIGFSSAKVRKNQPTKPPNILFIFSDDHALNAISAYGSPLSKISPTPNIDRIAKEGAIFHNSFCANSICGPSRASILTGKHSHKNGFMRNTARGFDSSQWTFIKALTANNYQTALIGKWHLKTRPTGFTHWEILPGQGSYYNPDFIQMNGSVKHYTGYATDIITDKAIQWLDHRDPSKPFILMCQHKAPHRTFTPPLRFLDALDNVTIPAPDTFFDNYNDRSATLKENEMEIGRHLMWAYDLQIPNKQAKHYKLKGWIGHRKEYERMNADQKAAWDHYFTPRNQAFLNDYAQHKLSPKDIKLWKYQRYLKNYLNTAKAVDQSVGTLLNYLDKHGLGENTVVIYSSDQGFYLGEHGWFDKRWMFEESFKMPFVIRWPGVVKPGSKPQALIQNIDYAPTFLEIAGIPAPADIQGTSIVPILKKSSNKVRDAIYYAYYEIGEHAVPQHFGVRNTRYKLFYLPATDEWQLFDLKKDPKELKNLYGNTHYAKIQRTMTQLYYKLRKQYDCPDYEQSEDAKPES